MYVYVYIFHIMYNKYNIHEIYILYIYNIFLITYSELKDELKKFIAGSLWGPSVKLNQKNSLFPTLFILLLSSNHRIHLLKLVPHSALTFRL